MVTLLYSGNFGLGHELGTILRAISTLNGTISLKLLLVGNGKGLAETHHLVEELGLRNTEFRPPVPLYELPSLLASGDVHLITQKPRTEGLIVPSKIYGTVAAGRPVLFVGPDHCEVARIIRESRCGFIVTPGDVPSAARALRQLVSDADLRRRMGERGQRYYQGRFGRQRSVARIVDVIRQVAKDRQSGGQTARRIPNQPIRSPVAATILASFLVLAFGLTYHALALRLATPMFPVPMVPEALERLPLQMGNWVGEDLPMEEAIVRATGTDAHVSRRYSRQNDQRSVSLFVGCSVSLLDRAVHRPEICYTRTGWTLLNRDTVEVTLSDGAKLPCSVFQFRRGELQVERAAVLHYYIVDGRSSDDISALQSRLWRLGDTADYLARVLIVAPHETGAADSAVKLVLAFAGDSAPSIARLFNDPQKNRSPSDSPGSHDKE